MKSCFLRLIPALLLTLLCITSAEAQISATLDVNNTSCAMNNGSAEVYPAGAASYTYQWSTGAIIDTVSGLAPSAYSVTVHDGSNPADSIVLNFNIATSGPAPAITTRATRDTICTGSSDLLIASGASGGTYTWSGGTLGVPVTGDSITISSISNSNYTYTVTWVGGPGCSVVDSISIVSYTVSASLSSTTQPTCNGHDGKIICISTPSSALATYYRNGVTVQSGTSTDFSNAGPGVYSYTVFDSATGCSARVDSILLIDTTAYPTFAGAQISPEQCYGDSKGEIIVTVGNCTTGCTYSWSQSSTDHSDTAMGLTAGTYTLSVTKGGCTVDTTYTVSGPATALSASITTYADSCGRHTGIAIATASAGTLPYTYAWSIGTTTATGDTVTQLTGDSTVYVTVTDAHGCADTVAKSVPLYQEGLSLDARPNGIQALGLSAEIQLSYTQPFESVTWSPYIPGSNNNTRVSASPDSTTLYTVTVMYGGGCIATDTVTIYFIVDSEKVVMPNTFTPNGDGQNDFFKMISYPGLTSFHIWIYDRWGDKVYESTDYEFQWDGTNIFAGNKPLNIGVYVFVVEYYTAQSGDKKTVGGNISLVR